MKVLIIEDEKDLRDTIVSYLKQSGCKCEVAHNYATGSEKVELYEYDCIIVDLGLPDGDGLKIIEELKQGKSEAGVIIISARNSLDDKLKGLDIGADDYLIKPFHLSELSARIKSLIRRRSFKGEKEIVYHEIKILPDEMRIYVAEKVINLTKKEMELLLYFIANQNKVLTKESIAEHLWGDNADMADSFDFIYSHIKNLRKKIIDEGGADYIKSIYGVGYKFTDE